MSHEGKKSVQKEKQSVTEKTFTTTNAGKIYTKGVAPSLRKEKAQRSILDIEPVWLKVPKKATWERGGGDFWIL